jgi:hypothetical protein
MPRTAADVRQVELHVHGQRRLANQDRHEQRPGHQLPTTPKGTFATSVCPTGESIDYVIDSENRRVAKKVNGAVVRKWIYKDQLKPVAEFDGSGLSWRDTSTA